MGAFERAPFRIRVSGVAVFALVLAAVGWSPAAAAATTTIDLSYGEDNCRLVAWNTCPATGACPPPSASAGDGVFHLDPGKLEPVYPPPAGITTLSFMCPLARTLFSGTGNTYKVNVSGVAPAQKAQKLTCSLYHVTDNGTYINKVTESVSTASEGNALSPAYLTKSLTMNPGTPTGPYYLACDLVIDTVHSSTGGLFSYRSEETMVNPVNATSQSLSAELCIPATPQNMNGQTGNALQVRYFYNLADGNGLRNLGSSNVPVECPLPNFVDSGTTRHLIVYITEASASGAGSTCHLASRTPYFDNDMNAGQAAFTKTTSGTSAKRSLDFTDSANLTDPQGYTLECQLKPGATINSLRFGAF